VVTEYRRKFLAFTGVFLLLLVSGVSYASEPRVLYRLKDGSQDVPRIHGLDTPAYLPLTRTQVATLRDEIEAESVLKELKNDSAVAYAEFDAPIHAHTTPNDALFDLQWALLGGSTNIGAEEAWNVTSSAENILVAVIDSGCDEAHEDIQNNLWKNENEIPGNGVDDDGNGYVDDVNGYDFFNHDSDPADDYGHGTIVFGIIGAAGNNQVGVTGLAWNARILCLKVLDSQGDSSVSTAIEAIEYAIREGAKIINMSWGYSPGGAPSQGLREALQKAQGAGILVVTSAGNGSDSTGFDNDANPEMANYPSSYPEENIIAVAATTASDQMAVFSNYGAASVDLGAPGVNIYSTAMGNQYDSMTGTSASAPHVTGSAALVWALNPTLTYDQVKRLLLETTDANETLQGRTLTGGRLNVAKAVMASPAAGGHLLEGPPPVYNTSLSTAPLPNEGGGAGGCAFQPGSPSSKPNGNTFLSGILFLVFVGLRSFLRPRP